MSHRPLRIVQLANFYGPTSGGLRVAVDQLGARYAAAGHRCTLVVPGERDRCSVDGGRTTITVRSPVVPAMGGYRVIVDRSTVRRVLARVRPDVVELSDKSTLVGVAAAARRRGARTVLISHERLDAIVGEAVRGRAIARRAVATYNRRLGRRVDAVVCASAFAATEFDALGLATERIHLGVDLDLFHPRRAPAVDEAAGRPPLGTRPIRIVAAVRLSPEKRADLLVATSVELARRGVDHELAVFGTGPLRDRLARDAADLPITWHGHVADRQRLAAELGAADVGIAPGPSETFGLAALELLACGTPVVVPDRGALAELVGGAPGDVGAVASLDGASFADGVIHAVTGDVAGRRARARSYAGRFGWDPVAARMLALFDRLA